MTNRSNLIKILENIELAISELKQNQDLHKIEIDLLLAKTSTIYEKLLSLTNYNSNQEESQKTNIEAEITNNETKEIEDEIDLNIASIENIDTETNLDKIDEEFVIPQSEKNENINIIDTEMEQKIIKNEIKSTLSDRYIHSHSKSIGEILEKFKNEHDISSRINRTPISNLKNAISINDRMMFTRELFNNNNEKFFSTIDAINNMTALEEALEYLNDKINLETSSLSLEKFMELVYRRFLSTDISLVK